MAEFGDFVFFNFFSDGFGDGFVDNIFFINYHVWSLFTIIRAARKIKINLIVSGTKSQTKITFEPFHYRFGITRAAFVATADADGFGGHTLRNMEQGTWNNGY